MSIQGLTKSRLFWPLVALFLLVMVNFWFNPDFFSIRIVNGGLYGSVVDIFNRAAPVMLIAMGMTLVIATRGIDISVGATVAISGAIAAALIGGSLEIKDGVQTYVSQTPMALAIFAALGAGLLCGLWNGFLVAGIGMQPIIATLILMVAGRGIAQLITGGQIVTIYYEPFFFFGNGFFLGIPFAIYLVAVVAAVLLLLVHKTALGLFIQAVGLNPTAARFSGISARALIFWVYGFCGVTAAVAGVIIASNVKSADGNNAGLMMELDAILAVALGGTLLDGGRFSLVGTLIGALILQTLSYAIYSLGVPPEINLVVKAIVVFVVCLIQSEALRKMLFQRRTQVEGQA
ncbi:MAG: ABC transporter permease [Propionivibrio sp.]|jgi:ribose/xylose/arabinose/galactoside ABC-type transport system permease subunit|nr:ABC transporter permease [Propionivibrio sp.]MBP6709710.1 ABC transporter permease [Propionivibrio sp.]MBP7523424.1 ABC transporter permease [Propionivibrio sp.]